MSSLKDLASLIMVPSLVKDGRLDTVKPLGNSIIHPDATGNNDGTDGSTPAEGNFTFSRGSNLAATRVDVNGLIEKGRENLFTYSNDFSNSSWLKADTSVTGGQADKDGTNNAWLLTKNASFGRLDQTISSSGVQTYSVYAKANDSDWIYFRADYSGGVASGYFDLVNGVGGSFGNTIDSDITSVGGGWYRIQIVFNATITIVRIYPAEDNNQSGGTSGSIYIQDAQLESSLVSTDVISTGASTAQAGILEDLPRLDYSASCPALLLEPQRSNLIDNSEYLTSGNWGKTQLIATQNQASSPEGLINSVKIIDTSFSGEHYLERSVSAGAGSYSFSVFAKADTLEEIMLRPVHINANEGATSQVGFSLQGEGSITTSIPPHCTASIEPYGNGWYRCVINVSITGASVTQIRHRIQITKDGSLNYAGSGEGVFVFGAQVEEGSYPTSYIPTMGSAVTRSKDSCVSSSLTTSTDFTIFFEAPNFCLINGGVSTSYNNIQFVFSDNGNAYSPNGSYHIYSNSLFYYDGANASGYGVIFNNQTDSKFVIMKRGDKVLVFANGAKKTEANLPSGVDASIWDTINLTESLEDGDKDVFGSTYKQLLKFDTALTDSECIALTTI